MQVEIMKLRRRTGGEEVVEIRPTERKTAEHRVHKALEGLRRVPEAVGHAGVLEQPKGSSDGSLGNILWGDRNLVICSHQIHLREYCTTMQMGGKVLNVWQRVSVRHSRSIQGTIVPTRPPVTRSRLGN